MPFFHGFVERFAVADDARLDHFAQQVVAFAGAFAHAGEDREAVVLLGDVVDQFLDEHGLAHAGAAEQTDLAALEVGLQQVDDLDAGEEDFLRGGQFFELGRFAVDGERAFPVEFVHAVDGAADHVHHPAADLGTDRHRDGTACGTDLHAAAKTVGRVHRHGAYRVLTDMLLHLDGQGSAVLAGDLQGFVDGREFGLLVFLQIEMYVDHGPDDLGNVSG